MTDKDEIAALKAEVDALKAALTPTYDDPKAAAEWRDKMRALSEARANIMPPSVVRDWAVLPDNLVRDISCRDNRAPMGPSSQGVIPSSQQISGVSVGGSPNRTGWARETPLSPPPGIAYVDRLLEVDSARQRGQAMIEEAKRKAAETK